MQLKIRDCPEGQPANGYKNFSKTEKKDPRLSNAEVIKKQDKNHKQTSSKHWSGKQKKT